MFSRILLAIDDSPSGPAAVSFTTGIARGAPAAVRVVHVNELLVGGRGHFGETAEEAAQVLSTAVTDLRSAGVEASGQVARAGCFDVASRIADAADEWGADVIVLGSRRRVRWGRLRGKGLRERITGLTTLPVMTAPPPLRMADRGALDLSELLTPPETVRSTVRS
jgi:nucleotide-binding universal stress UspA family protein